MIRQRVAPAAQGALPHLRLYQRFLIAALALAVQAQITLPVTTAGLRLNAADPVIGGLMGLALLALIRGKIPAVRWRMTGLPLWLAALTAVLTFSLILGYWRLGHWSMWAIANKYAGWFALLGYFTAGAWISAVCGTAGQRLFAKSLLLGAAAVIAVQALPNLMIDLSYPLPKTFFSDQLSGWMGNPNAFAFLLLTASGIFLAYQGSLAPLFKPRAAAAVLAALLLGLWYAGSRSGYIVGAILIVMATALRTLPWIAFRNAAIVFALLVGGLFLIHQAALLTDWYMPAMDQTQRLINYKGFVNLEGDTSMAERLVSYTDGIKLWTASPILGSGLGGFLADQIQRLGRPLIIHSTGLWILTEMGLVGAAVFGAFAWRLARSLSPFDHSQGGDEKAMRLTGVLVVAAFLVISLAHEMMYQRVLWLILGLVMVLPRQTQTGTAAQERQGE